MRFPSAGWNARIQLNWNIAIVRGIVLDVGQVNELACGQQYDE